MSTNINDQLRVVEEENLKLKKLLEIREQNAAMMLRLNCPESALTPLPKIIREVAAQFAVSPDLLFLQRRTAAVVVPRQTIFYLARRHTRLSLHQIGDALRRDHTTVSYAVKVVQDRLDTQPEFAAAVAEIERRLCEA